jgi:release factor glutamine methyltransferase
MAEPGTVGWGEIAALVTRRLVAGGVDNAVNEARWMVEQAAGMDTGGLAAEFDVPATTAAVARIDAMVARRLAGEPLQYVLGQWTFRTLELMVDPRVLIPRPETEQVVAVALDELDRSCPPGGPRRGVVVDLGTGSGAIALSMAAERPGTTVVATDVSADAADVAAANLAGLGMAAGTVSVAVGSWFDALEPRHAALAGTVDVVVSNPPYVADHELLPAQVADFEPHQALVSGPSGTEAVAELVAGACRWLRPGGALVVEIAPHQAVDAAAMATAAGYVGVTVAPDLAGRPRTLVARQPL